ncbi:MAG: 4-(cytidine 5'-diphospho)-2-C-methyl-D-erythritol kinase [Verrucomicrobia bacterium]|nr:4-(cytidine 5'-diphospho)-2-C-methyl-D-erythritol kinase [Verrucomicrobiota bacterium]
MSSCTQITRAPAKINLFLEVMEARADGYHDLRSVVVPVSVCDELKFTLTEDGVETRMTYASSRLNGVEIGPEENLATRAAQLLKERTGHPGGVLIEIEKHIPLAAGLGGGSADAAAVLTTLNELWNTGLSTEMLMELGFALGCDIPALVRGGAVCMEGLGEVVRPITSQNGESPDWWLILVNPGFSVSTPDIYSRYTDLLTAGEQTYKNIRFGLERGERDLVEQNLFNSLQSTAFEKYSLLEILQEALSRAGGSGAMLSGSGGSLFAFADSPEEAEAGRSRIEDEFGDAVWCQTAQVLWRCPMV